MLPYRLRPSTAFRSGRETTAVAKDDHEGGGVIQTAIEKDLQQARQEFLNGHNDDSDFQANHAPLGQSFQQFRKFLEDTRACLLHTRCLPPRCDPEQYSQLIYGACLRLLVTESRSLSEAAVSLFFLFALYQSNPLPKHLSNPLESLPMGIRPSERRRYAAPIRIDSATFAALQIWRETAEEAKAQCQFNRMQEKFESNLSTWKCTCSMATDFLHVFDALRDSWDRCAYTGPVGVEAYAGHPDYPFLTESSSIKRLELNHTIQSFESTTVQPLQTIEKDEIKLRLDQYKARLKAIVLPTAVNKRKRLQKELKPLFHSQFDCLSSNNEHMANQQNNVENGTGTATLVGQDQEHDQDHTTSSNSGTGKKEVSFSFKFTGEISTNVATGIRNTLRVLAQSGRPLDFSQREAASMDGHLQTTTIQQRARDELSSLGQGGISMHRNIDPPNVLREGSNAKDMSNFAIITQGASARNQFLALGNDFDNIDPVVDDLSDISEDEQNDMESSQATSAVGQKALKSLLGKVRDMGVLKDNDTSDVEDVNETSVVSGIGREALAALLSSVNAEASSGRSERAPKRSNGSEPDSMSNISGAGRAALHTLLSSASKQTVSVPKQRRVAARRQIRRNQKRARQQRPTDESVTSKSDVGRKSLETLLSLTADDESEKITKKQSSKPDNLAADAMSVVSGAGRQALGMLLSHVEPPPKDNVTEYSESVTESPSVSEASGMGRAALNKLLLSAVVDQAGPPSKRRSRRPKDSQAELGSN